MNRTQILLGDCRARLQALPDGSVDTCVTSPPYFGLRDYGVDGQIGLEATPDQFVAAMVEVFRDVRRVLRDDGTLWLNLGDSYARNPSKGGSGPGGKEAAYSDTYTEAANVRQFKPTGTIKEKDLIGIPWMVAFALRADGWYLRQENIWSKPNCMPESVRDRCTRSHEQVFLLSKSPRYYYDADAIAERAQEWSGQAGTFDRGDNAVADHVLPGQSAAQHRRRKPRGLPPRHAQYQESSDQSGLDSVGRGLRRNKRSVWTVATRPFAEAHFATFPPELIEPCILAGCRPGGTVLDPFGGAGTTGLVANRNGRDAILCELNSEYAAIAERRIYQDAPMFSKVEIVP